MTTELLSPAARLVALHIRSPMSSLVATLAKAQGSRWRVIEEEEIYGLTCQALELSAPVLDYESAAEEDGWLRNGSVWIHDDWPNAEVSADAACSTSGIEPHGREVNEHWAISTWLAEKLTAKGERVDTNFAGLNVWARASQVQPIAADPVLIAIAGAGDVPAGREG